jgi:lysophospholipase L1-like esterase
MKYPVLLPALFALGLIMPRPAALAADSAGTQSSPVQFIPASDPRFHYEGRIDFSTPAEPVIIWQGSRISLDFAGPVLALRFAGATDQNFFNAQVDDQTVVVAVPAGGARRVEVPLTLGPGRHRLMLFKRTEAGAGHAVFAGVEIAAEAGAWAPAAPAYRLRMEFFGDSIMAGACNEDGTADQWEDRRTHNNALSYTALTAAAFSADYRCTAVSGMGVEAGYVDVKAGQVWDRLYPVAGSPRADLAAWPADVVLVNFGENDDSFPRVHGQPFPADYVANYVALVRAIRAAYPYAHLVLLRGGMFGGAKSPALLKAWTAVVETVEAADPAISHFVFTHWTETHPRVSDDRILAGELVAWLRAQPFMQRLP